MEMANEIRLIDANELTERIKSYAGMFTDELGFVVSLEAVIGGIEFSPTVDAVPVVRCKDCKHRGDYDCPMYREEYIEWEDDGYHESEIVEHDRTSDDGFCDRGERRTDNGN